MLLVLWLLLAGSCMATYRYSTVIIRWNPFGYIRRSSTYPASCNPVLTTRTTSFMFEGINISLWYMDYLMNDTYLSPYEDSDINKRAPLPVIIGVAEDACSMKCWFDYLLNISCISSKPLNWFPGCTSSMCNMVTNCTSCASPSSSPVVVNVTSPVAMQPQWIPASTDTPTKTPNAKGEKSPWNPFEIPELSMLLLALLLLCLCCICCFVCLVLLRRKRKKVIEEKVVKKMLGSYKSYLSSQPADVDFPNDSEMTNISDTTERSGFTDAESDVTTDIDCTQTFDMSKM